MTARPVKCPASSCEVQQVNKDNVYDLVVKSGFQSYDDVYRDIPEAQIDLQNRKSNRFCYFPASFLEAGNLVNEV